MAEISAGGRARLGDFTTTPRVLLVSAIAVAIGALSAFVALALLRLIGLFTNIFFPSAGMTPWSPPRATT